MTPTRRDIPRRRSSAAVHKILAKRERDKPATDANKLPHKYAIRNPALRELQRISVLFGLVAPVSGWVRVDSEIGSQVCLIAAIGKMKSARREGRARLNIEI